MRIDEINTRLSAIQAEIDTATGDALTALEQEVEALTAERQQIQNEVQTRQQLRANIAAGLVTGTTIENTQEENTMENRTFTPDSAEYREAYLSDLQGRDITAEQRAALTAQAHVIPTQTMNRIVRYIEESPILSRVDLTYIPSNISLPISVGESDAAWVDMGAASTDSSDGIMSLELGAYKLIKTVEITADLQVMAIDAFENWIVENLGEKIQKALDAAVFNGTGVRQATGICQAFTTNVQTFTKAKAKYSDLVNIVASLPSGPARNATFAMQRKLFFTDVIGIEDQDGQPVCHPDVASPAKYNILGYPVVLDDNVPADSIIFGDFKMYKLNISKAPTVTSDDSVGFRTGSRVYRAMALADGKPVTGTMSAAFVYFKRATS